jgi:hypothetical protein
MSADQPRTRTVGCKMTDSEYEWLAAVDSTNPQSWNRYAYVQNNPLAWTDPFGLCHSNAETRPSACHPK